MGTSCNACCSKCEACDRKINSLKLSFGALGYAEDMVIDFGGLKFSQFANSLSGKNVHDIYIGAISNQVVYELNIKIEVGDIQLASKLQYKSNNIVRDGSDIHLKIPYYVPFESPQFTPLVRFFYNNYSYTHNIIGHQDQIEAEFKNFLVGIDQAFEVSYVSCSFTELDIEPLDIETESIVNTEIGYNVQPLTVYTTPNTMPRLAYAPDVCNPPYQPLAVFVNNQTINLMSTGYANDGFSKTDEVNSVYKINLTGLHIKLTQDCASQSIIVEVRWFGKTLSTIEDKLVELISSVTDYVWVDNDYVFKDKIYSRSYYTRQNTQDNYAIGLAQLSTFRMPCCGMSPTTNLFLPVPFYAGKFEEFDQNGFLLEDAVLTSDADVLLTSNLHNSILLMPLNSTYTYSHNLIEEPTYTYKNSATLTKITSNRSDRAYSISLNYTEEELQKCESFIKDEEIVKFDHIVVDCGSENELSVYFNLDPDLPHESPELFNSIKSNAPDNFSYFKGKAYADYNKYSRYASPARDKFSSNPFVAFAYKKQIEYNRYRYEQRFICPACPSLYATALLKQKIVSESDVLAHAMLLYQIDRPSNTLFINFYLTINSFVEEVNEWEVPNFEKCDSQRVDPLPALPNFNGANGIDTIINSTPYMFRYSATIDLNNENLDTEKALVLTGFLYDVHYNGVTPLNEYDYIANVDLIGMPYDLRKTIKIRFGVYQ